MTRTKNNNNKIKKVSFENNVKDNKNIEFIKVKSFLEKEIEESYKKYLDSSYNTVIENDYVSFKNIINKNQELRKQYDRKIRTLAIINKYSVLKKNLSIEGYFYRYYRDNVYYRYINNLSEKIEL